MGHLPYMRDSMPIFSKIKDFFGNSNHSFASLVLTFSSARLLRFCFCCVFLGASFLSNSGLQAQQVAANVSQDQQSASNQAEGNALDSSNFYPNGTRNWKSSRKITVLRSVPSSMISLETTATAFWSSNIRKPSANFSLK